MSTGRKILSVDESEAGMKLADRIVDATGNVLLPAGATLTESALVSLRRRGVESICVEVELPSISPEELAARRAHVDERLAALFRRCGDNGALGTIRQSVRRFRLEGNE